MANRLDQPQAVIKRILASNRSDKAKAAALAKFVTLGDSVEELDRRIAGATQVIGGSGVRIARFLDCGLSISISNTGKVEAFGYWTGFKDVWLAE
jgi:hypothetical protein